MSDKGFRARFSGQLLEPIPTPYMAWKGMPDDLLTFILQRTLIGLESYLPGAVHIELDEKGQLTQQNMVYLRNPFAFRGNGTADNYYNRLPGLLSPAYSLKSCDEALWDTTRLFYKEVRNLIFHGSQVEYSSADGVLRALEHVRELYMWIDSWHDPDNFLPGARKALSI